MRMRRIGRAYGLQLIPVTYNRTTFNNLPKNSCMRILLAFVLSVYCSACFSQNLHCGTDEMHQKLYMGFPGICAKVTANAQELEQFTANFSPNPESKAPVLYTIPVVFHVIHNYGAENISDDQIHDQMAIINEDFQKLNADTVDIVSAFDTIAANCQIEFKLAKKDPLGNCTNGITRHVSTETYTGDHAVKSIVHWDPSMYLNVYICADAAGLAGHALVPAAADTVSSWDGIVLRHDYCGSIGTSTPFRSTVLTHEIGHYLNLQHTWGGNNVPGYPYLPVADAGNCAYDDGVGDTPLTIGWQTCNLSGNTCSSLDNVQNYMEYAYCAKMFTEGQKARMHATLNSSIANRDNLWKATNLTATGVNDPDQLCKADFTWDKQIVCAGDTVWLTDRSYHLVTTRSWDLTGATVPTQTDSVAFAVYTSPGEYDVELLVGDGSINDTLLKTNLITVLPVSGVATNLEEGFESASTIPNSEWAVLNEDEGVTWELYTGTGYEGTNCVRVESLGQNDGQKDELISYPINVSFYTDLELNFRYSYAKATSSSHDKLSIFVSKDCGETWVLRKTITTFELNTVSDTVASSFVPTSQSEWALGTVTNILSSFYVNNLQVKFVFESGEGNNIYLDNINLFDPNTVDVVDREELEYGLYPNPATDNFVIKASKPNQSFYWKLFDRSGKLLMKSNANGKDIGNAPKEAGWYVIKIYDQLGVTVLPLVVIH